MTDIVSGQRLSGGYVLLVDVDGLRHAVRQGAILALSDADDGQGATVAQLTGGRRLTILASLDEVLGWISL